MVNVMSTLKKHILHVDDDPDIQAYVEALLSDIVNVTSVYTAKEFYELVDGISYDLFILDLVLKDGSGFTMSKKLKKSHPDIPIVLLSSHQVTMTDDNVTDVVDEIDASFVKGRLNEKEFIETITKLMG